MEKQDRVHILSTNFYAQIVHNNENETKKLEKQPKAGEWKEVAASPQKFTVIHRTYNWRGMQKDEKM